MTESLPRRPVAVRLDAAGPRVTIAPEPSPPAEITPAALPKRGRGRWGALFVAALGGLVSLAAGLSLSRLVEDAFARSAALGSVALALALLLVLAVLVLTGREVAALMRLGRVEQLKTAAERTLLADDRAAARALAGDLLALYRDRPDMARARGELSAHGAEIIDGADLVRLAERTLMAELDTRALALVLASAKRVSLVTAVSPRALFDILMVTTECARLIRALAELYGVRPGSLGFWRLARAVLSHLAITGGMAMGETLVQQLVGHGLAARLSAKLGEGVINGLLTARVGLATIDIVRPLPFVALERPKLGAVIAELGGLG